MLRNLRRDIGGLEDAVMRRGSKSHALYNVSVRSGRLRLLFMSFTTGYRPDILDIESFDLGPNPLEESQTGVDWTHCVGGRVGKKYLLLIEKSQAGIWPRAIERYFQWLIDQTTEPEEEETQGVVVNIEPLTDLSFVERLESFDRIKRATFRIPKPNPGWSDLEEELGQEADESDAAKAGVTMHARRLGTLRKGRGIVAAIKRSVRDHVSYALGQILNHVLTLSWFHDRVDRFAGPTKTK